VSETRNAYKILVQEPLSANVHSGGPSMRWQRSIKKDVREMCFDES
jgi:hypothetical protein